MPILTDQFISDLETLLGTKAVAYFRRPAPPESRAMLEDIAAKFRHRGNPVSVALAADEPILDLGGEHRNDSWLMAPLAGGSAELASLIGNAQNDQPPQANRLHGVLLVHRFLDGAASTHSNRLIVTVCAALIVGLHDEDSPDFFLVDPLEVRVLKAPSKLPSVDKLKQRLDKALPNRDSRRDADLSAVYAVRDGKTERLTIKRTASVSLPLALSDNFASAFTSSQLTLGSATPANGDGDDAILVQYGKRQYPMTSSQASAGNLAAPRLVTVEHQGYGGPTEAPPGYTWGDPLSVGLCNRRNRDSCMDCCDNRFVRDMSIGSGLIAAGAGIAIGTAGAGLIIGGAMVLVGAALIGFSAVTTDPCRSRCTNMYNEATGEVVSALTLTLIAVQRGVDGRPVKYKVVQTPGDIEAIWPRERVAVFAWGGAQMQARFPSGEEVRVTTARYPHTDPLSGQIYLRTVGEREPPGGRPENNLAALPEFVD